MIYPLRGILVSRVSLRSPQGLGFIRGSCGTQVRVSDRVRSGVDLTDVVSLRVMCGSELDALDIPVKDQQHSSDLMAI